MQHEDMLTITATAQPIGHDCVLRTEDGEVQTIDSAKYYALSGGAEALFIFREA